MQRSVRVIAGFLVGSVIFYGFHRGAVNIETASTGFNASSRGLFGWDYSSQEHAFKKSEEGYQPVLINSEEKVRIGSLVMEVLFCAVLGLGVSFGAERFVRKFR